jgi:cytochrome c2
MADAGEKAAGVKCTSCHKMTDERLVGPGWKGVTERQNKSLDHEFHHQS